MKIELFEVEGRPVARVSYRGKGTAWVWDSGAWRLAPGLIGKSTTDGIPLSREDFVEEFPQADLDTLDDLAASVPDMERDR